MPLRFCARALIGAAFLAGSTSVAIISSAAAAPADYRFELVQAQPAGPGKTTVTVSLVHVPDNKPVAGAVLFESKTDMGPDGMAEMTGKVTPLPSDKPGIYRFAIETGMAGKWALNLGAKVQGGSRHGARHRHVHGGEVTWRGGSLVRLPAQTPPWRLPHSRFSSSRHRRAPRRRFL